MLRSHLVTRAERAAHAAGLPAAYPQAHLSAPDLAPFRAAIDRLLEAHLPYPAMVVDGRWNVVWANQACATLFGGDLVGGNMIRRYFGDRHAAEWMVNWTEVAWAGLGRLHQQLNEGVRDARCVRTVTGTRPSARCRSLPWRSGPGVVIPPAFVAACQGARLADRPPGPSAPAAPARAWRYPAAVVGGPPGRGRRGAAGRAVVPARRPGGRDLRDRGRRQPGPAAGPLADLGFCQPDGTFIARLDDLRDGLAEMAEVGEAVCVDGLATRVQRPCGWANQKVLYDAKRHAHTAQGLAVSTIHGDLLWVDGGWPGSCHEHELIGLAGLDGALDEVG